MSTTRMSNAAAFPTRLTDEQWAVLEPLVPATKPGDGRPAFCGRQRAGSGLAVHRRVQNPEQVLGFDRLDQMAVKTSLA